MSVNPLDALREKAERVGRKVDIIVHFASLKTQAEVDEYLTLEKKEFAEDWQEKQAEFMERITFNDIRILLSRDKLHREALSDDVVQEQMKLLSWNYDGMKDLKDAEALTKAIMIENAKALAKADELAKGLTK